MWYQRWARGKALLKTILASLIAEKCISEDIKPERTKNIKVAEFSATGRTRYRYRYSWRKSSGFPLLATF